jgi:two-component system, chemotaxis family, protein-glutamate methylesterase/glutaminase
LIIFCEECGTQHEFPDDGSAGKQTLLTCEGCHETLTVPDAASSIAGPSQNPIRLLIVDDSRLIRTAVRRLFASDGQVQVVGEAANGREALDLLPRLKPDVITLDINMPEMDGLSTLKHIMIKHPTPTVMFSALTREGATETFDALRFGAIDFMPKPSQSRGEDVAEQERLILQKVKVAAGVETGAIRLLRTSRSDHQDSQNRGMDPEGIVVLGASEGGYGALLKIVPQLPPSLPAACIAILYADAAHVSAFADYLNANSAVTVKRAMMGDALQAGTCYLASGSEYTTLQNGGGRITLQVNPSPFPERRGAINMLMLSVSEIIPHQAIGVVLTGKGNDGAEGAAEIRRVGGTIILQDPPTCLFQEMVQATLRTGKADHVCADLDIASAIKTAFGYQTN